MNAPVDLSRRAFFRGTSAAAVADEAAWDEVMARAARFGIVPGSYIDADGTVHPHSADYSFSPFIGELVLFAFDFAPRDFRQCEGQLLPIASNQALFSLLGTSYGGDGRTNFALPDLRGRTPIGFGAGPGLSSRQLADRAGQQTVTLATAQLPAHAHAVATSASATTTSPTNGYYAPAAANAYASGEGVTASGSAGGGQPHPNLPPYLSLTWAIAIFGIFPPRP